MASPRVSRGNNDTAHPPALTCTHSPKLTHLEKFDGSGRRRYQVQYLGECRSAATGALIKDKPYVTAYLLDQTPLQEGRVLFSEINTIMYLAARIDMESEFQGRDSYMVSAGQSFCACFRWANSV